MTPQDTLPLVLEDELVRISVNGTNISGAIRRSVALNRIAGLLDRNPGTQFDITPTDPPRRRVR